MPQTTEPTPPPTAPSNSFGRLLSDFNDGGSLAELSNRLQQMVEAVESANRPGTITYVVTLTPASGAIVVSDDIKIKLPKEERAKSIFFPTEQHMLVRNNPAQKEFTLREVQKPAVEVKEIEKQEPEVRTVTK